jgi:hypothetical protein
VAGRTPAAGIRARGHEQPPSVDLLSHARRAGVFGPAEHKVTGDASVRIDLAGFPRGTKTKADITGLFKEVKINRGRALPTASQES